MGEGDTSMDLKGFVSISTEEVVSFKIESKNHCEYITHKSL